MFCKECGHENRNDRKFCSECGKPLPDYTKPKQDLVMPDDVKTEKAKVINNAKISKVTKIFNILLICLLVSAISLTTISFLVKELAQTIVVSIAFSCFIALFIVAIIKFCVLKTLNKKQ